MCRDEGATRARSEQPGDRRAMATKVVQQGAYVGGRLHEDDQESIGVEHGDHRESGAALEDAGVELTAFAGMAKLRQSC